MRLHGMLLTSVILLVPALAFGKSLFVRDNAKEALVRTGPSTENKIITILKPGQEVTLVEEQDSYYVVATPGGAQGYVLKYQMTEQSPAERRIQEIEQRSQQRIQELETQAESQQKQLVALRTEREQLDSARKAAEERAQRHESTVTRLQAQQRARRNDEALRWFLAGAGVLLLGVLCGRLWGGAVRKNRRGGLTLG